MQNCLSDLFRFVLSTIFLLYITGCTSVPEDLGRGDVDVMISERGLPVEAELTETSKANFDSLISKPLNAEAAIRIALINNPQLKATYAKLGFAAADVYEAGRIRNPIFLFATLDSNVSGESNQTQYGLITSFTDLITLPARKRLAAAEFAAMKQSVGAEVLNISANTETAFYHFVAAKQVAALRAQIAKAGSHSLELAKRYYDAGNLSPREFALEHAAASELQLASLEAEAEAYGKRVELASLLGLSTADAWDSPAQLPVPLDKEDDINQLITLAQQSRLDLAAAYARTDIIADRLGVTNWTRWLSELNVGIEHERESDGAQLTGPIIEWELPIFTQGRDSLLRRDAELHIAMADVERLTIEVENGVRLAYAATQNTKARVDEYREKLIPARIEVVNRAQEEENFMLIGIFELLETKQQEYDAYQGYLEVVRDYWLARTQLARAVGNTLPSSAHVGKEQLDVEEYITPKISDIDHTGHGDKHEPSSMTPTEKDNASALPGDHSNHNMEDISDTSAVPQDEHDTHSDH